MGRSQDVPPVGSDLESSWDIPPHLPSPTFPTTRKGSRAGDCSLSLNHIGFGPKDAPDLDCPTAVRM